MTGLFPALFGEPDISPARKPVFKIPLTLAVTQKYKSFHIYIVFLISNIRFPKRIQREESSRDAHLS